MWGGIKVFGKRPVFFAMNIPTWKERRKKSHDKKGKLHILWWKFNVVMWRQKKK